MSRDFHSSKHGEVPTNLTKKAARKSINESIWVKTEEREAKGYV